MRRVALWLPALAWACLTFALSSQPAIYSSESAVMDRIVNSAGHAFEYAVFAVLLWLPLSAGGRFHYRRAFVVAALLACAFGAGDEVHQSFVPGRDADPVDWLVDCVAAIVTLAAVAGLQRRAHRRRHPAADEEPQK